MVTPFPLQFYYNQMHSGEESMEKSSLKLILSRLGRLEPSTGLWTMLKCGDDDFLMISTVWWAGGGEDERGQLWIVIIMTIIALTDSYCLRWWWGRRVSREKLLLSIRDRWHHAVMIIRHTTQRMWSLNFRLMAFL